MGKIPWSLEYRLGDAKKRIKSLKGQLEKAQQELIEVKARLNDPMSWTLDYDVEFSMRTYNCLKKAAGISTLGELTQRSAADLLKIKNFGNGCLVEVEQVLTDAGLYLVRSKPRPIADVG